jgi:hypothetical protein
VAGKISRANPVGNGTGTWETEGAKTFSSLHRIHLIRTEFNELAVYSGVLLPHETSRNNTEV